MNKSKKFLKFISLNQIDYWDVKRYLNNNILFNNSYRLSDILELQRELVSREDVRKNKWRIISKINFSGELFLREMSEIDTYKGNLYKVSDNNIIYSKINVRHGCIYYHQKEQVPFVVSNEYPIFKFNDTKVNGDYLKIILRSESFKKLLNTKTSGISKSRVKIDEFLNIQIPLPSLEKQNELLEKFNKNILLAQKQENEAIKLQESIEIFFNKELGIKVNTKNNEKSNKLLQLIDYFDIEKWGVDKLKSNNQIIYTKKFLQKNISSICMVSSGGTPNRSNKEYYTGQIPWIKTGEVVNGIIMDTEEKITEEAINNSSAKIYPKDSLLIAMYGQGLTRGRTAKLGIDASTNQACAVLSNINNEIIDTDYLWYYLMNEYYRLRELASGNNQPNLNAEMIKNYKVIIPPFEIQEKIVLEIKRIKNEVKILKEKAELNRQNAIKEFEKEIFIL